MNKEDWRKLEATGMAWEFFPNGRPEEVQNEPSNSDVIAAVTSFVKNYGRDVPSLGPRGAKAHVGASEQMARPCSCCASAHGVGTN